MKINRVLVLIGFLLYVVSFLLVAAKDSGEAGLGGYHGYLCAWITLSLPFSHDGWDMLREKPLEYVPILVSGWINPLFLVTAGMLWAKPHGRAAAFLRIVVVLMLPACWIVFHNEHLRPWTGYWLWTAAMLAVLFSTMFTRQERVKTAAVAA